MLKVQFLSTKLDSSSLKAVADRLSEKLGYKVLRSCKNNPKRNTIIYGDQKDKTFQYRWFQEQGLPALCFTTSQEEAASWVANGETVMARCLTRASEGRGIVVLEQGVPWVVAPVYTRYIPKKREFRAHVFKDQVVTILEKRRKVGVYNGNSKVRNTANGYVFCSSNIIEPDGLRALALAASKVTNSDFKGVDIGYNEKKNQLFVIEVNSAPGIEGSNVDKYVEAICSL